MGSHCDVFCIVMYMSCDIHNLYPGVTFSLRGNDSIPTDGSARVLITDINPNGYNDEDALICRSEMNGFTTTSTIYNWYLHPTQMSTDKTDKVGPVCVSKQC